MHTCFEKTNKQTNKQKISLGFLGNNLRLKMNKFKKISIELKRHIFEIFDISVKGLSQRALTCSKLTIETLEQSVKYVPS